MKKKNEPLEVHVVQWRDSAAGEGWENQDTARRSEVSEITTVGFLLAEYDDRIVLSGSTSAYGALAPLAIPTECITDHQVWTL